MTPRVRIDSTVDQEPPWQQAYSELDEQLLSAHARDDKESLVSLYKRAAGAAESRHDPEAARFYLTHAYVFALDTGSPEHLDLKERLDVYHA